MDQQLDQLDRTVQALSVAHDTFQASAIETTTAMGRVFSAFVLSFKDRFASIFRRFDASLSPLYLSQKNRKGKNLYRGKERRRIKLLRSQLRRGVLQ